MKVDHPRDARSAHRDLRSPRSDIASRSSRPQARVFDLVFGAKVADSEGGESSRTPERAQHVSRRSHRDAGLWTLPRRDSEPTEEEEAVDVRPAGGMEPYAPQVRQMGNAAAPAAPGQTELDPVFDRVIQQVAVLEDRHRRRRVRMTLAVRGRSRLRVEIAQGGHGAEVRFATADDDLARELRRRRRELTDRARSRGVTLAAVHVD